MGFGGGGSGSFVLPNHKHTNVLADGGNLEELVSLIDGITLKVWLDAAIAAIPVATAQAIGLTAGDFSTTSTSWVDVTGMSLTLPNTSRVFLSTAFLMLNSSNAAAQDFRYMNDSTAQKEGHFFQSNAGAWQPVATSMSGTCSGQVIKIQVKRLSAGTLLVGGSANSYSHMESLET